LARVGAPLLLAALVAGACSSSSSKTSSTSAPAATTTSVVQLAAATLNGDGSTFQKNYDDAAIEAFNKVHANVTINYNGTGSGQGQTDLEGQVVDFAGSDVPISAADTPKLKGGAVLYFPTVAAPITVSYNLTGVSKLQLSGPTIAKIFSRSVKTWNDASIAADNPGVTLPSKAITVAHRSDGSGTTANFTKFLKLAGGTAWTLGSGKTVNWSADTQAGKGNPGVVNIVKNTDGAIGYIDFSDAKSAGLSFASIKNSAGTYVAPSLDGASAAVAGATVQSNLVYDPINATGADAYPVTSPTWIIVYAKQADAAKAAALKAFLSYILSADGQALAQDNDYAKLPSDLVTKATAQLDQLG
jgi:phosphate transport system substrate-binding protein